MRAPRGVRIRSLTKRYGDVGAVDDLSLEMAPGELVSLLGPSGCGKTTTLRLVAGFLPPDTGEIWVGDRCLSSPSMVVPPEQRRMAMIFQSYALWPHMTVAQNVGYGLRFKRDVSRGSRESRVREILRVVQLTGYESRYPGELSGGQQQRVAVARALVVEPEILLLDEPLSNLDANLREEMRFEIRRLHEAFGITTLYVTHDQAEAMVISDRIAVLEHGRVAQVGTAEDLFERPATRFVAQFIGRTNLVDGVVTEPGVVAVRGEPRSGGEPSPSMAGVVRGEPRSGGEIAHDGLRLRVATADAKPGATVAVSIRPHAITLIPDERARVESADDNVLRGVVKRASYLGAGVDYEVDVAGVVLRVAAAASSRVAPGTPVTLVVPIARCLPLPAA
jgi:iron(III) transport system ATP-binding protein